MQFILVFFLFSCELESDGISKENQLHSETVSFDNKNNTIIFKNSNILKKLYDEIKNNKDKETTTLTNIYEEGFTPLRPLDNLNENLLRKILLRKQQKSFQQKSESDSDIYGNNLISNDYFASLLNDKGEVQVADSIYKYTSEGVFIAHIDNRSLLDDYPILNSSRTSNSNGVDIYTPTCWRNG